MLELRHFSFAVDLLYNSCAAVDNISTDILSQCIAQSVCGSKASCLMLLESSKITHDIDQDSYAKSDVGGQEITMIQV